jgi:hypothetical protein
MKKDDPYAGLYVETDKDPYAGLFVVEEPNRTGMDKATQIAGVTTDAFLPYATAAGLGALATGVPTGGLGAPIGAGAGMLALGVGDLGTSIYNLGASLFNGERMQLPSETISQAYRGVGIGRAPETTGERIYSDTLKAAVGGGSTAKGFQLAENVATSPQTRNFMNMMGQNVRGQIGASIGAGGAPSVASNYFGVENPYALTALSLASGVAGGKMATPSVKPVTAAALKEESDNLYLQMRNENVNVAPQAMTDLDTAVRGKLGTLRYDPHIHPMVTEALKVLGLKAGQPISFDMLDEFRKYVRDLPYAQGGKPRGTPAERAIISDIDHTIDDYMKNLTPGQTTSGNSAAASALLQKAREVGARRYQTETLEDAFTRASNASKRQDNPKPFAAGLRSEFKRIADDPRQIVKFDAATQKLIRKVADGTITQKGLQAIGKLAPSALLFKVDLKSAGIGAKNLGYGAGITLAPGPTALVAGTTIGAKGIANQMTVGQGKRALISAAQPGGGGVKPGGSGYFLLSPTAQQNVLAQDRAKSRKR